MTMKKKIFSTMFNFLLIILIIICSVRGITESSLASPDHLGNLVSIQNNNFHQCTGIILNEEHILTAAHCVFRGFHVLSVIPAAFTLTLPMNYQGLTYSIIRIYDPCVSEIRINNENRLTPDIIIFKVSMKLTWSSTVLPIRWIDQEIQPGSRVILFAWSSFDNIEKNQLKLAYNYGTILSDKECRRQNPILGPWEKCIVPRNLPFNTEFYDCGTPVYDENYFMIGMIVKESDLSTNRPATFLPIHSYSEFIKNTLQDNEVDAEIKDFPYVVSIWYLRRYRCGGIIISETRVITAAHCVDTDRVMNYKVVAGYSEAIRDSSDIQWRNVIEILIHKKYLGRSIYTNKNMLNGENDIALVDIQKTLPFDSIYSPRELSKVIPYGRQCQILRWKRINILPNYQVMKLKKSTAVIRTELFCNQEGLWLTNNQFCASHVNNLPITNGEDIGNPIICENNIVGIAVDMEFVEQRSPPRPTIFLHVFKYLNLSDYRLR